MASRHGTAIEWTHVPGYKGETWNPWVGCTPVGPGCENCWACRQANRFKDRLPQYEGVVRGGKWTGRVNAADDPQFYAPIGWRDPRAIFVGSMTDFFHEGADDWREYIWHVMHDTPRHLYLILTKRPERIPECLPSFGKKEWPWPNVWLGASVENNDNRQRIEDLLKVPAAKHFLSFEPMLGPLIDLNTYWGILDCKNRGDHGHGPKCYKPGIDWVIVGGESGSGARPMHPDWARGVRDQCQAAGVPFFFKQWGEWLEEEQARCEVGEDTPIFRRCVGNNRINGHRIKWPFLRDGIGDNTKMIRVGKKRAGRLLDGRTWEEFPE